MTKKRWIVLAGILAACVCLTLAVLALLSARPGVTPANIERIEIGMTRAEVEEILGGPGLELVATVLVWRHRDDGTRVFVYFDRDNRVTGRSSAQPETFRQKLQRLLRL